MRLEQSLAVVRRAGDALVERRPRIVELEAQLRGVTEGASRSIERLQGQIEELQHHLHESEARRDRAEEGLLRLCSAIREQFPSTGERSVQRAPHQTERLSARAS